MKFLDRVTLKSTVIISGVNLIRLHVPASKIKQSFTKELQTFTEERLLMEEPLKSILVFSQA